MPPYPQSITRGRDCSILEEEVVGNRRKMDCLSSLNALDNPVSRIRQNLWLFCVLTDMVCKEVFSGLQSVW